MHEPSARCEVPYSLQAGEMSRAAKKKYAGDHGNRLRLVRKHPRRVCMVDERGARHLANVGPEFRCREARHAHYSRERVLALIKSGEARWVGKHQKIATWTRGRQWRKTMSRDGYGSVAVMQWVQGG